MSKIEHTNFSRLIGKWNTSGSIVNSENNLQLSGTDTYEWILDGHFILHKADVLMGDERSQTFEIIKIENSGNKASMQFYNSKGEHGAMISEIDGNEFRIVGDKIKFEGEINEQAEEITGSWFLQDEVDKWNEFIKMTLKK